VPWRAGSRAARSTDRNRIRDGAVVAATVRPQMVYRAENVGSLLRPQYLLDARDALAGGGLGVAEFKRIEDRAVDEAVALQRACGLDVLTDGECRRLVFTGSLLDSIAGIDGPPPPPTAWRGDAAYRSEDLTRTVARHSVSDTLRRVRSVATEEYVYLRARASEPAKATLPSPLMLGKWWNPTTSTEAYPDPFLAFADAAAILKEEIAELARLGCPYVQIDATDIATLADPAVRRQYDALGIGAERMLDEGIDLLNSLTTAAGDDVTLGIHLCKGNAEGRYIAAGGYDAIARRVFPRLPGYDVLLLEYDDERSGGFEPLTETLEHQIVVLGLISTKNPAVESDDDVLRRIDQAVSFVPLDRLALSCQCGFASTAAGNKISPSIQRQKLELVGRVARRVWG
jgi:5-methyltetrahydropteroyltriglutamate--homocysteine methyltransferase